MIRSFVRTLRGHSRDPRMAYITRPLPKDLHDEDVVAALDIAMAGTTDPGYLVETLRPALRQVTGHDYQVLDRTARDVTGAYVKPMVMIRDGDVGLWPGYAARAYPLLARNADLEETRAAIAGAEGADGGTCGDGDGCEPRPGCGSAGRSGRRSLMGRQNVPRDQWLEIGSECPHCGERLNESQVYSWRPMPEDPKLLLLRCPNCNDRIEINHI